MRKRSFSLLVTIFSIVSLAIFPKGVWGADYYSSGTMTSTNLLSGLGVSSIVAFGYNVSSLPTDTSIQVRFSQDSLSWYNSLGVENGWDSLLYGDRLAEVDAIDLTGLDWGRDHFYYQVQFGTSDTNETAVLDEVIVYYTPGPSVETEAPTNVSPNSATANSDITALSGGNATTRGFEYGLTETGTWDVHEDGDFGTGPFSLDISNLDPATTYFIRAYVTNPESTGYGLWESFTTGEYASSGTFTSSNLLSGETAIIIKNFNYTLSEKPENTQATVQFSLDSVDWYNSANILDGTDILEEGTNSVGLCALRWGGDTFYYRIEFTSSSTAQSPVLDGINLVTDDSENTCSPVLYLKFDEGYGTLANNTGYGGVPLNGSITGAQWTNEGKSGKALVFNGSGNYVQIPDNSEIDFEDMFTLSGWFYPTSDIFSKALIVKDSAYRMATDASGRPLCQIYTSGTWQTAVVSNTPLSLDSWQHVLCTYDQTQSQIRIYINATLRGNEPQNETVNNSSASLRIGSDTGSTYGDFSGRADEIKIFNYALSGSEIKVEHNLGQQRVFGSTSTDSTGRGTLSSVNEYCPPGQSTPCVRPVAEWRFDESQGQYAYDTSENNNTGTLGSGSEVDSADPVWVPNLRDGGWALEFDGTDDYLNCGSDTSLHPSNFTLEYWVKSYGQNAGEERISSYTNDAFETAVGNDDSLKYYAGTWRNTGYDLNVGQWYHVAFVYNGSTVTVYVNSQNKYSNYETVSLTGSLYFGERINGVTGENFEGIIDNPRLYNYARTPAQIAWSYNRGAPTGHWRLDECSGTTAYDSSGNENHGNIVVGSSGSNTEAGTCSSENTSHAWYNGVDGKISSSLHFDGTDDFLTFDPDLDVSGYTSLSLSAWIYKGGIYQGVQSIISKHSSYDYGYGNSVFSLTIDHSNYPSFLIASMGDPNYSFRHIISTRRVEANTWHHIAGAWDGIVMKLYLDGNLVASGSYTGSLLNIRTLNIGRAASEDLYFGGKIDEVKIWNYALTRQQILNEYNQGAVRFGN